MIAHQYSCSEINELRYILLLQRNWVLSDAGTFHFEREQKGDDTIPTTELATRAIEYARELEMII